MKNASIAAPPEGQPPLPAGKVHQATSHPPRRWPFRHAATKVAASVAALIMSVGLDSAHAAQSEVLLNRGFDNGSAPWVVGYWGGSSVTIAATPDVPAHSGSYLRHLSGTCSPGFFNATAQGLGSGNGTIGIPAGALIHASAWFRCPNAATTPCEVRVRPRCNGTGVGASIIYTLTDNNWHFVGDDGTGAGITMPANDWLDLRLYGPTDRDVYVDDAKVLVDYSAITGTVVLSDSTDPTGTTLTLKNASDVVLGSTVIDNPGGTYSLPVADGTYTVVASRLGYSPDSEPLTVTGGSASGPDTTLNLALSKLVVRQIAGTVTLSGAGLDGATVTATSPDGTVSTTTASGGTYSLAVYDGSYTVAASKFPLVASKQSVQVVGADANGIDFAVADSTLVWYKFDGNGLDSSGNGKNGSTFGGAVYSAGGTLDTTAANGGFTVPMLGAASGTAPLFDAYTMSAWVKCTTATEWQTLYADQNWSVNDVNNPLFSSSNQMLCSVNGTNGTDHWYPATWGLGKWHFMTVAYDSVAKTEVFYFDGVKVRTDTFTTTVPVHFAAGGTIGCWGGDVNNRPFHGRIDDFRIFSSVLSDADALNLYNSHPVFSHAIVASVSGTGGSISPLGSTAVDTGDSMTYTFAGDPGYGPDQVSIDGGSPQPAGASYTFTDVQAPHTISVTFAAVPSFNINASVSGGNGTISPSGDIAVDQGKSLTYTFIADPGYIASQVTIDGGSPARASGSYTFTDVQSPHTISVTFKAVVLPDGAVAYWSFDGTLADLAGGNTLTKTAGTLAYGPGNFGGSSLYLDGNTTLGLLVGSFPTGVPTGSGTYTVSAWIKADTGCPGSGGWIGYGTGGSANLANNLRLNGNNSVLEYWYANDMGASLPSGNFFDGWHSVIGTWDGTTETLYLDGVATHRTASGVNVGSSSFVVGKTLNDANFKGWVGDLLILNRAMTASEVAAYNSGGAQIQPARTISGTISDAGGPVNGASVKLKKGTTVVAGPVTTAADGFYSLSASFSDGDTCTVSASILGDLPGTLPVSVNAGVNDYPNSDITLAFDTSYDPTLLFSMTVDSLTGLTPGNATGSRATVYPVGGTMVALSSPKVIDVDGLNWEHNTYSSADGYRFVAPGVPNGAYSAAIPATGVSVVAVVQPTYIGVGGEPRGEIVDLFYSELFLAVSHNPGNEGEVIVNWRGYNTRNTGYKIPNGQKTILCLVVQQNGDMVLFANGANVWSAASGKDYSTLQQSGLNGGAKTIAVGRNDYDGWSTFSGNIGDVYLYKTAISDTRRSDLQSSLATKFGIALPIFHTITASADANGSINPSGTIDVPDGQSKTFSFYANDGFVDVVTVDGIPQSGHPTSYTFTNVTAPHTLAVTFTVVTDPPPNDNFAAAIALVGNRGTQTGTRTNHATFQAGEPICGYDTTVNTVWFKWTAPSDGAFTISTLGSRNGNHTEWDAVVGIYTGTSLADLVLVPGLANGNPQDTGLEEIMQFAATAGTTYYFQMGGDGGGGPNFPDDAINILLNWSFVGTGASYADWANANVGGQAANLDFNNDGVPNGIAYFMGATGHATNPVPNASRTVTWPMSATFTGSYEVQTSSDLLNWAPASPQPSPAGGYLSYTLAPGSGKHFVRLLVTPD